MSLLLALLTAHVIGDFVLQRESWVEEKFRLKIRSPRLYYHMGVHLLAMIVLIQDPSYWAGILFVFVSHYLIDLGKIYLNNEKREIALFIIDQILHLVMIALVVNHYEPQTWTTLPLTKVSGYYPMVLALLLSTFAGSHIVRILISPWTPVNEDNQDDSLQSAGTIIGMLERLFVFGFVVSGYMTAVGFLLATKSVFRFGDLRQSRDRKLTEYMLIGTLLSFGWGLAVSAFYLFLR